jgi:hypothetical protein
MSNNEPIIACNPGAIDTANRDAHIEVSKSIFSAETIIEIKEMPNGYGFRLPLETTMIQMVADFVANERLCCPFFTFTLVIGGQFWLELTGAEDVKDIIKSDILNIIETGNFPALEDLQADYDALTGA